MTAYLRQSCLSSGGLSLTLKNEDGQFQDAQYVRWTVSSAHDGRRVSGIKMNAVRRGVGRYYAPWFADDPTGAFEIEWEYQRDYLSPVEKATERFFVMDLDDPTNQDGHIRGLPPPTGHVFEPGVRVSGNSMTLRLTNENGVAAYGHMVMWRVECSNGCVLIPWQAAKILDVGIYGVDFTVTSNGGQYFLRWQWSESAGTPLQEIVDTFQIVNPRCPQSGVEVVGYRAQ